MIRKNAEVDTISVSNEIAERLRDAGRVKVDARDIRPGQKCYDWEIKGTAKVDVGPRDIAQGTAFAAKRTGGKEPLSIEKIEDELTESLGKYQKN